MTPPDHDEAYQEGLRDGRLISLENSIKELTRAHNERFQHHDKRITTQERITFGLLGAITLLQLMPFIERVLDK